MHGRWLANQPGGQRAPFNGANLMFADFTEASVGGGAADRQAGQVRQQLAAHQ